MHPIFYIWIGLAIGTVIFFWDDMLSEYKQVDWFDGVVLLVMGLLSPLIMFGVGLLNAVRTFERTFDA